jgi:hypothetical protein
MKRWLVAVAILVGGAASFSYADYVLIRAVLGGKREDPNNPNPHNPHNPPGNLPGPGGPRGPGGPGGPGGPPGSAEIPQLGAGQTSDIDTAALAVQAVVAVKRPAVTQTMFGAELRISHRWSVAQGMTRLFNDNATVITRQLPIPTPASRFPVRRQNAFKGDRKKVLELGEWALAHGLNDEFADLFDDLVSSKEDQNQSTPPELKAAIKAFVQVKAALDKPIEGEVRANFWRTRLSARMETSKHYAVIYTAASPNPPEVQSRLAALENHMRGFYYWFALRGNALPVPPDKMVAVLLAEPSEFRKQRAVVEDEPLVTDGFYAHRDHICVFSAQRLDTPFQVFEKQVHPLWASGSYDKAKLLDGTEKRRTNITPNPAEFQRVMTLALLERALADEAERAAVTHEGTRQLLVATGLIPRTVVVPQWAEFGSAAVFETPKGPFPGAPITSSVAIFPGIAGPSWAYLRYFKENTGSDERGTPPELLKAVVTDSQFNKIVSTVDQRGQLVADREGLLRARSNAWALAYYLIKARLPGMLRYYQELSALPRDLEMDERALLACFARAFDVANVTNDGVDPAKFEQLAKDWLAHVRGLPVPGAELGLERELGNQHGQPNQPGQPATPPGPTRGGPGRP